MTRQEFIERIASYVVKYAPKYNIKVHSPIIAQAILESAYGTSELAKVHNYFGLKYRKGRCKTCTGVYSKVGSEQHKDGSYSKADMRWCKFNSMEDGVIGYFDFTNIGNYSNLKGITNPKKYLENIKADGYATSLNYVDNLLKVIKENNLTKYDKEEIKSSTIKPQKKGVIMNKVYISAGHDAKDPGAVKYVVERDEVWEISDLVAKELKRRNIEAYRDGWNYTWRQTVNEANKLNVDLFIEFHENAGKGNGAEAIIYSKKTQYIADAFAKQFKAFGQEWRRTIVNPRFWVIKNTKMPAAIVEVAFVDNKEDIKDFKTTKQKERLAVYMADAIEEILTKQGSIKTFKPLIKARVNVSKLNIRDAAKTGKVIGVYDKGREVDIIDVTVVGGERWGRTARGWISLALTEIIH